MALLVIFVIVIVFWMAFHQNQLTLTYFANDNTDWSAWGNVSGVISNAINPFWIITLTCATHQFLALVGEERDWSHRLLQKSPLACSSPRCPST